MRLMDIFKTRKREDYMSAYPIKISSSEEVARILDKEMKSFFPVSGIWYFSCYDRPNDVIKKYLPCNTTNYAWMSQLLEKNLEGQGIIIPAKTIQEYIEKSEDFEALRKDYELRIVAWQIDFMKKGGNHWLLPNGCDELYLLVSPNVDTIFRAGVVKTLEKIGIPRESIEEGLEKNADVWRKSCMEKGYSNIYEPSIVFKGTPPVSDETHKENWLKLRLFNYYCEHKSSIDKYGEVTQEMKMTENEVEELRKIVKQQNKQRKAFIEEWDKNTPADVLSTTDLGIDDSQDLGLGF